MKIVAFLFWFGDGVLSGVKEALSQATLSVNKEDDMGFNYPSPYPLPQGERKQHKKFINFAKGYKWIPAYSIRQAQDKAGMTRGNGGYYSSPRIKYGAGS
ncbi:MAG: hypothetical protein PHG35_07030 [Dehalococcoidales bacterium]|nr:hypothetical protein [Dehalococcoidales bacterium]